MRVYRMLFNWAFMITSPVWVLPVFVWVALWSLLQPRKYPDFFDVASGKSWII